MNFYVYSEDRKLWFCGWHESCPIWANSDKARKSAPLEEAEAAAERLGGLFRFYPADRTASTRQNKKALKTHEKAATAGLKVHRGGRYHRP